MLKREEERPSSPSFEAIAARDDRAVPSRASRRSRRIGVPVALAITIAGATASGYALARQAQDAGRLPPGGAQYQPSLSLTTWTSPTDFLLAAPGGRLLRGIPGSGGGEQRSGFPANPRPGGASNKRAGTHRRT